jgi:hypothetical protein
MIMQGDSSRRCLSSNCDDGEGGVPMIDPARRSGQAVAMAMSPTCKRHAKISHGCGLSSKSNPNTNDCTLPTMKSHLGSRTKHKRVTLQVKLQRRCARRENDAFQQDRNASMSYRSHSGSSEPIRAFAFAREGIFHASRQLARRTLVMGEMRFHRERETVMGCLASGNHDL